MNTDRRPTAPHHPRLTPRGAFILVVLFLTIGPIVSFGVGIPVNLVGQHLVSLASGIGPDGWGENGRDFWAPLMLSPIVMVIGLPFYGGWADTHLAHVAAWIACVVILMATSKRGFRMWDVAGIAAGAVLVFPFLIEPDSPAPTWRYPDAVFMAVSAAGGATTCAVLVRGLGPSGRQRRLNWGWLA